MGLATSAYHVLFLRFFDRIGKGVRGAPRDALLSQSCGEGERGKAFGFQRAMDHAGAMAGPLVATLLLSTLTLDLRTVFILSIVPAFFCVFILFRGVTDITGERTSSRPPLSFAGMLGTEGLNISSLSSSSLHWEIQAMPFSFSGQENWELISYRFQSSGSSFISPKRSSPFLGESSPTKSTGEEL
jgi:MFS family permease